MWVIGKYKHGFDATSLNFVHTSINVILWYFIYLLRMKIQVLHKPPFDSSEFFTQLNLDFFKVKPSVNVPITRPDEIQRARDLITSLSTIDLQAIPPMPEIKAIISLLLQKLNISSEQLEILNDLEELLPGYCALARSSSKCSGLL